MADVRPGTKPRQPSKKSHTNAADEPKLLDSLTVADGSCNASTVPLVNYSFKVNVTKLFFDGERADARGADLIWALYNLLSFTVRVLVPLVYGLMKECGSGFLYTLLVRTHLDIIMPMPFVLSTFVGGAIVGLQKVRNLFLQTGPDRRRGCSMGDMARSMVMAIFMETVWWLALPYNLLCAHTKGDKGRAMCAAFLKAYSEKVNLEIRGAPSTFMGVQIEYNISKGTLFLHQKQYIEKAFDKFCDKATKLFTTPVQTSACDAFTKLRAAETDEERMMMSDKPYLSLMGSILWAVVMTRPDCAYYASFLCQFMADPTVECWHAAIALLSYMYNSRNLGLLYKRCGQVCITLYSDSSYGSVPKPAYGYVVFGNGTPLSWASKKEKIVPQSSSEAETYALNAGCKTLMFVKNMLAVLGMTVELPIQTHTDNDATRLTAINPGTTARTKHYHIWMAYVRELYLDLIIAVNWVPTKEQIADLLTKPLDKTTFLSLRTLLMTGSNEVP